MGSFFEQSVCKLVPGTPGAYAHWFGGTPRHKGVIPPGREHQVHLLYDLDLADPVLGVGIAIYRRVATAAMQCVAIYLQRHGLSRGQ